MSIHIYNSMTKKKEEFKSLEPQKVKMYVCGPTVYDDLHIGNFRGPIFFNFVRNFLEFSGYDVRYVFNYTDVDDKILKRATEKDCTPQELAETYIKSFEEDYASLKLDKHTDNPRCTDYVTHMIEFVQKLVEQKKAYVIEGQGVYFRVQTFDDYGKLSGRSLEDFKSGHRIDVDTKKEFAADFALWKFSKDEKELGWDTPWGKGRPGWHIECSVMAGEILGQTFDIHGGGLDLLFPHHENEIAQSESCHGQSYVNYWIHHNMIEMGDQKMSKSLGNIIKAKDFIKDNSAELFKFATLNPHYRSPLNLGDEALQLQRKNLYRFYASLKKAQTLLGNEAFDACSSKKQTDLQEYFTVSELKAFYEKTLSALKDDFNTPEAFSYFYESIKWFNKSFPSIVGVSKKKFFQIEEFVIYIKSMGRMLALFQENPTVYIDDLHKKILSQLNIDPTWIDLQLQSRSEARKQKDFAESDRIRDLLKDKSILIMDGPAGTEWQLEL